MKRTLLAIKRHLDKLSNWLESLRYKSQPIKFLCGLVFFILLIFVIWPFIICPAVLIICLTAFTFPWVHGFLLSIFESVFLLLVFMGLASSFRRYILWKTAKKLVILPICFLAAVFILGGVIVFGPEKWVRMIPAKTRFPLSLPKAIAVDSKGQIYLYCDFYFRLQVFNAKGEFLRGWFPSGCKGVYRMWIDENDYLVVGDKKDRIHCFNANGELINKTQSSYSDKEFGPLEIKDTFGNTYKIRRQYLSPKVLKITPQGQESILVKDPFSLWLVTMLFPGALLLFGSLFIFALLAIWEESKRILNKDTTPRSTAAKA